MLLVVQDEADDWLFETRVHEPDVDTAQLICLHHVVERDPSLRDVLKTLPPRYQAHRETLGSPWQFEPYVED